MDALETVVREIETHYNALNAEALAQLPTPGVPFTAALVFAFGRTDVERLKTLTHPAIGWDELDGDITLEPDATVGPAGNAGMMQPRCEVTVWAATREQARNVGYLLMKASRLVPPDKGTVEWTRYTIAEGQGEIASHGFEFHLECRVHLGIPIHPIPVTTEVIVLDHDHEVTVGGEVVC